MQVQSMTRGPGVLGSTAGPTRTTPAPPSASATPPSYFRTYEQVKSAMLELQAKYPNLVRVEDVGDGSEKVAGTADRDVLALVIGNRSDARARPTTLHTAGIHAREIANPELLLTYARELLEGYGKDAESTMVVDERRTVLVPILNPDGHAVVERGYSGQPGGDLMQRKNTAGGSDPRVGVDLNRNLDYHWGGAGASTNPRSDAYRGPKAASEPETQALQKLIGAIKPSFYVDWHSHSRLNMYPWGDTREPTKDHAAFKAMAQRFTSYNGYRPIQTIDLYPTTGTTMDYAYGVHGVPSMAVETGSSFHQSDREFAQTVKENLPAIRYVSRAADAPLARVQGPDATDVVVDAGKRSVTARLSDERSGGQALAGAELVLRADAAPGSGTQLAAADGKFDSPAEDVVGVGIPAAREGARALVYVRGRDAAGNWGPLTPQWLGAPSAASAAAHTTGYTVA